MSTWILIIMLTSGSVDGKAMIKIEGFTSMQSCHDAAAQVNAPMPVPFEFPPVVTISCIEVR